MMGHWARDCRRKPANNNSGVKAVAGDSLTSMRGRVNAEFQDEPVECVLDAEAEFSIIGQRHMENLPKSPPLHSSVTIRDTEYPVVGSACYVFCIEEHMVAARNNISQRWKASCWDETGSRTMPASGT